MKRNNLIYSGTGNEQGGYGSGNFYYNGTLPTEDPSYWQSIYTQQLLGDAAQGVFRNSGAGAGASGSKTGGLFSKLKSKFGGGASGAGAGAGAKTGGFFAPGATAKFGKFTSGLANPQFDWSKSSGIQGWGKNIGKGLNIASALYQGYDAAQGLKELADTKDTTADISSDIVTASYNDPMLQYNLSADQMDLLRQLRRGTYDSDAGFDDIDWLGTIGAAAKNGIMGFIGGGIPGAVIGAVGGGGNAIIDDLSQAQGTTNAELEALYQAILESEQQYNNIRKQRAYANLM